MPKWSLFGLCAVGNFVIAVMAFRGGRLIIPLVLAVAGVCFIIAAGGAAMAPKSGKD